MKDSMGKEFLLGTDIARHDYFRCILCNLIGGWVENGEYPNHDASLKKIVEGICYNNAAWHFGLL